MHVRRDGACGEFVIKILRAELEAYPCSASWFAVARPLRGRASRVLTMPAQRSARATLRSNNENAGSTGFYPSRSGRGSRVSRV